VFYRLVAASHAWRARRGDPTLNLARTRSGKPRALYSRRRACELLRLEGAQVLQVLGYYCNIAISPLDEILPAAALWVTQKLEERAWPAPEWIRAGMIVKARKIQS
jgi:hypothetical protein